MLYDRILFNLIELHVNARLDSYSFDYTCIIINFYKSSILFLFFFIDNNGLGVYERGCGQGMDNPIVRTNKKSCCNLCMFAAQDAYTAKTEDPEV